VHPIFDVAAALVLATTIGSGVGIFFRFMPKVSNRLVPILVLVGTTIADIALVVNKFLEAAGVDTATLDSSDVSSAGFFGWKILGSVGLALGQLVWQRIVHEKAILPVVKGSPGQV